MVKGSCLCGAVSFHATGEVRPPVACHCTQCRKTTGHYWAACSSKTEELQIDGNVSWFRSSDVARRGFCGTCGSTLFWQLDGEGRTSFSAGVLDGSTGMTTTKHIFVDDKADYYQIAAAELQGEH